MLRVIPGFMSPAECRRASEVIDRLRDKFSDVKPPAIQGWSIPSWGLPQEFWGEMEWLRSKGRELGDGARLETLRFSEMREGHYHVMHKDNQFLDGRKEGHQSPNRTSAGLVYLTPCDGGDFLISVGNGAKTTIVGVEPGLAVTFPAEYLHGTNTVTAGVRQAITCWYV